MTTKADVKNSLYRLLISAMCVGGLLFGIIYSCTIGLATPDEYQFLKGGYYITAGVFFLICIYCMRKFHLRYKAFKILIVLD